MFAFIRPLASSCSFSLRAASAAKRCRLAEGFGTCVAITNQASCSLRRTPGQIFSFHVEMPRDEEKF